MIRAICQDDIIQCVNVIRESFGTVAKELGVTEENAPRFTAFATTKERLDGQLNEEHRPMYGYYEDGKLIGYYSLCLQDNQKCELNNLCVLPEYRHKKIGYKLLENAFETLYDIQPLDDTEPWYTEEAQQKWNKAVGQKLWSEFEKSIGLPNTTEMIEQSENVTEGMPSINIRDHMDVYWKEQFGFISKFQDCVKEWIENIDTSNIMCKKKSLIGSDDCFMSFNYTDVLEKIYCIENVLHIHGGVSSICDIPPVMGHFRM